MLYLCCIGWLTEAYSETCACCAELLKPPPPPSPLLLLFQLEISIKTDPLLSWEFPMNYKCASNVANQAVLQSSLGPLFRSARTSWNTSVRVR